MKDYKNIYNKIEKAHIDKRKKEGLKEVGPFNNKFSYSFGNHYCTHYHVNEWSLCKEHNQTQEELYDVMVDDEDNVLNKCEKCIFTGKCPGCEEDYNDTLHDYLRSEGDQGDFEKVNFDKLVGKELDKERKIMHKGEVLLHSGKLINKYVDMHGPKVKTDGYISKTGSCYLTLKQGYEELKIMVSDHFIVEADKKSDQFVELELGQVNYDGKKKEFFSMDNNQSFGGDLFDIVSHHFANKTDCLKILKLIKDFFK